MQSDNEKHDINIKMNDLDATSLYPTAMTKINGFVKGQPKPIKTEELKELLNVH